MVEKDIIRKQIFSCRENLTPEECLKRSESIYQKVISDPLYRNANQILCYVSYKKEVSTIKLIEHTLSLKKDVLVPKVIKDTMIFVKIHSLSELRPGIMGILEPDSKEEAFLLNDACMIMPGVAFDQKLHRIGYGGGYYDKYLEIHPDIPKIALAFDFQILDQIPYDDTDLKPDKIITENTEYIGDFFHE